MIPVDGIRKQPHTSEGEAEAQGAGGQREQAALDQQLADNPPAGRSERDAYRKLTRSADRARQQQIGDIDARHQQNEPNGNHQCDQDRTGSEMARKRSDDRPGILVCGRIFAREASSNRRHFCLRLSRCAPSQRACRIPEGGACLASDSLSPGRRASGCQTIADDREPEAFRHDADHGGGHAVDPYTASDDGRVCVVPRCPNAAAQHDDRWCAGPIIVGHKIAAKRRLLAEQLKCVR